LMSNWAQNDPGGAGKFLTSLPEGKSRESAIQTYIGQLSWQSPEYAAPFVSTIADENQRYSSAQNIARNYIRNDEASAIKWINSLELPADKKERLLKLK
jgi:hypothetical protein